MHSGPQASPPTASSSHLTQLTDTELERRLGATLAGERAAMIEFLLHLGEFDRRRTYLDRGYPSLFDYCTGALLLSKAAAFRRITAARLLRRFPAAADHILDGRLCLTTLAELRDLLTEENSEDVLRRTSGLTREQVQALVAASRPAPVDRPPDTVRPLPAKKLVSLPLEAFAAVARVPDSSVQVTATEAGRVVVAMPRIPTDRVQPLGAELRVLRVTVSQAFLDELAEVRLALSHAVPDGGFEAVVRECFRVVLKRDRDRRRPRPSAVATNRAGDTPPPAGEGRPKSRHIPRAIQRAVWTRDGGQCAFRARDGRICGSRHRVQFHHCEPYGVGGATSVENISLRCAAHNGMHARHDYGRGDCRTSVPPAEPVGRACGAEPPQTPTWPPTPEAGAG
jgi:hypothetical protein